MCSHTACRQRKCGQDKTKHRDTETQRHRDTGTQTTNKRNKTEKRRREQKGNKGVKKTQKVLQKKKKNLKVLFAHLSGSAVAVDCGVEGDVEFVHLQRLCVGRDRLVALAHLHKNKLERKRKK